MWGTHRKAIFFSKAFFQKISLLEEDSTFDEIPSLINTNSLLYPASQWPCPGFLVWHGFKETWSRSLVQCSRTRPCCVAWMAALPSPQCSWGTGSQSLPHAQVPPGASSRTWHHLENSIVSPEMSRVGRKRISGSFREVFSTQALSRARQRLLQVVLEAVTELRPFLTLPFPSESCQLSI